MKTIDGDDDSYDEINKIFDGRKCWRDQSRRFHRDDDKPAVIFGNGVVQYAVNGIYYSK